MSPKSMRKDALALTVASRRDQAGRPGRGFSLMSGWRRAVLGAATGICLLSMVSARAFGETFEQSLEAAAGPLVSRLKNLRARARQPSATPRPFVPRPDLSSDWSTKDERSASLAPLSRFWAFDLRLPGFTIDEATYRTWYGGQEAIDQFRPIISRWVHSSFNFGDQRAKIADAWLKAVRGEAPESDLERDVAILYRTRAERWRRLAERLGTETPRRLHAYRGVHSTQAELLIPQILDSWKDPARATVSLRQPIPVASWSLSKRIAESFSSFSGADVGVLLEADIPLQNTVADVWLDHPLFDWTGEKEVIAGTTDGALLLAKDRIMVFYRGMRYTARDASALAERWAQRGETGHSEIVRAR